ncbi:MAG: hypothetical protein AVDCRST_MAG11-599 [uncultured Gemmatimonadaceae bacterium]|uniref:Uncharacterized protein n=1 Tax=uncultured Gemmatimonadaceae bacterium TaxID=246130 RepID=A0A6J4K7J9_9BACT|nr:MAG: hypothetical protein AVDCRST_MAG11-599 [uncultured Gemmatimonadaceae bacterium]
MAAAQRGQRARGGARPAWRVTGLAWLLALGALGARPVLAQGGDGPPLGAARRPHGWIPHLRLHAGAPQRASLAVGAVRVVRRAGDGSMDAGPLLLVEPGLRAGKVRAGYGRTGPFAAGYSLTAAYLRAWGRGDPRWTAGGRDHAGAELHGSLMFVDVGVGAYRPLRGPGGARAVLSVGLGP